MKKEVLILLAIIAGFALIQSLHLGQWGKKDMGPLLIQADDSTFDQKVAEGGEWVLVKFWAPWCGNCRRMMPTTKSIAEENLETLTVITVNVDEVPGTTRMFGVQPIPCFVLLQDGREVGRQIGVLPENVLQTWIDGFRNPADVAAR